MSFRTTVNCYHSLTHLVLLFTFPFGFMSTGTVISFATEPSSFAISTSLMWLLLLMLHPLIWPFIIRDLVYHYWLVNPGQVLCVGLICLAGASGHHHDAA